METHNPELKSVLPKGYQRLQKSTLTEMLRLFAPLPRTLTGDAFGLIYEDFLSNFAMAEGRLGGEFFTPYSIVRLIVEIIEPFHGKVYDPACGSGGMFVQCAKFVERHAGSATRELSVYGQEQKEVTVPLAKMNLALHGLSGDIRLGNSYYDDLHDAAGRFDFVMANPPFNVNGVDKGKLAGDKRFPFGLPKPDNGNYLWVQQFYAALNDRGRAGFVMANSAGDAGHSEKEIRRKLVETGSVDVVVAIGPNFFYTVSLPVTLWFLDKGKTESKRRDEVLFIDARHLYRQVDKAHRDFSPEHVELFANVARLYRGEDVETADGSEALLTEHFPDGTYVDVPGLCKVATRSEIEAQGWSLNPGRYAGTAAVEEGERDIANKLLGLYEDFASKALNEMARAIFRDWFIDLQFPGHEDTGSADSTLGLIPDTWRVRSINDIADVAYGRSLPKKDMVTGPIPVYGAASVIGFHAEATVTEPTIVMGCRGTCGGVALTSGPAFVTNNSFTITPKAGVSQQWLFHALAERGVSEFVGGSAQPQITLAGISPLELAVPPPEVMADFENSVRLLRECAEFKVIGESLGQMRDILLPKLIASGAASEGLAPSSSGQGSGA